MEMYRRSFVLAAVREPVTRTRYRRLPLAGTTKDCATSIVNQSQEKRVRQRGRRHHLQQREDGEEGNNSSDSNANRSVVLARVVAGRRSRSRSSAIGRVSRVAARAGRGSGLGAAGGCNRASCRSRGRGGLGGRSRSNSGSYRRNNSQTCFMQTSLTNEVRRHLPAV